MTDRPRFEAVLGAAIPTLLRRDWEGIHNSVRWTESVPVEQVQAFMADLPGEPVRPTADQVINDRVVLSDNGNRVEVLMPIALTGTDMLWAMSFILTTFGDEDGQPPNWLWGLGKQKLMTPDELRTLVATHS